jgi:hypothetical protein
MSPRTRNTLLVVIAIAMAFGIGAAWQFTAARAARAQLADASARLDTANKDLAFERLESALALATIAAQLGNFERGRQLASDFFTGLQAQVPNAPADGQASLQQMLQARDATITQLSRSDPGSGLELSRMLVRYRQALGRDANGLAPAAAPAVPDTSRN